jgi:hypothetical protein
VLRIVVNRQFWTAIDEFQIVGIREAMKIITGIGPPKTALTDEPEDHNVVVDLP